MSASYPSTSGFLIREIRELIHSYAEPHNAAVLVPEWVVDGFYARESDWGEGLLRPSCPNCGLFEEFWQPWPNSGLILTGQKHFGEGWYSIRLCSRACEQEMEVVLGLDRDDADGASSSHMADS